MLFSVCRSEPSVTASSQGSSEGNLATGPGEQRQAGEENSSPRPPAITNSASDTDIEASASTGVTQNTPYLCGYCSRAFPRLSFLKRHEQGHADQLPFRCCYCGRHFKHKRSRDRHLKLHTGDKKYKCGLCDAAFSRSDHLKIHLKTHDSQKPHQCGVCCRGYSTAAALTAHMQSHKVAALSPLRPESRTSPSHSRHSQSSLEALSVRDSRSFATLLRDSPGVSEALASRLMRDGVSNEHRLEALASELKKEATDPGDEGGQHSGEERDVPSRPASLSPPLRCPLCATAVRSSAHLQQHMCRYHAEVSSASGERPSPVNNRPASAGTSSGSGGGGLPSATSTPSPRPPGVLSPRSLGSRVLDVGAHSSSLLTNPSVMSALSCMAGGPLSLGASALAHHHLLAFMGANKLACCYCAQDGFSSVHALELHIHSMHGFGINGDLQELSGGSVARPLSCELCGARVPDVSALQRHVVTSHSFTDLLARTAEGVFCAQCLLPFSNPGALTEHIKLVHTNASPAAALLVANGKLGKRPQSPVDLPTDLSKKSKIETSSVMDSSSTTLLCNQCNAPFNDFESFRNHLKTHLDGYLSPTTVCPECKLVLPSDVGLENHLASHLLSVSTEYGCQACFKLFSKPDELQKHLMDIHAHLFYRCSLCKDVFDSKVAIQVHFAVKHSNECKVKKCTKCSVAFHSRSEFEQHVRTVHMHGEGSKSGAGYRCLLCHLTLASEAEFTTHLSTHQKQFQCTLCDEAFHVEFLLDKHMQAQHNSEINGNLARSQRYNASPSEEDLRCELCNINFPDESSIISHYQKIHGSKSGGLKVAAATVSLYCAYCNEACKSRAELEAHVKLHQSSGGRHKCNICDELCPSAATLAQHKLSHIKALSGSIVCSVCGSSLVNSQEVLAHQTEHCPGPLPQPCVVCKQTMLTNVELKAHSNFHGSFGHSMMNYEEMFKAHSNSKEMLNNNIDSLDIKKNSLKCPLCQIKLETLEEVENHSCSSKTSSLFSEPLNTLQNKISLEVPKTYQCIKCQESFPTEGEVEAHVALHLQTEGSNHECHICRATFKSPLRLQCHLIEHTFEGCSSYTCYLCSTVFTVASRLQQHMLSHGLNSKPYDCHHCHQRFFFKAELENHVLSHAEVAAGKCSECQAMVRQGPSSNMEESKREKPNDVRCKGSNANRNEPGERQFTSTLKDGSDQCNRVNASPESSQSEKQSKSKLCDKGRAQCNDVPLAAAHDAGDDSEVRCQTCGRCCRSTESRALHELTHEGARPYLCGDCGSAFTRKCDVKKHSLKVHQPYKEQNCKKNQRENEEETGTLRSKDELEQTQAEASTNVTSNISSPSEETSSWTCQCCSREFSKQDELAAHVHSSHGGEDTVIVRSSSRCSSCSDDISSESLRPSAT
ncbi:zinc finger protein 521 isoform X2 [Hyalella azteca]|uniref:Zinc finger protein 521 isoform X2 n=1 Tax=Hyalella azteca TaxID=294128 RepID=A0A8B7NCZ5_HYAAZ|nr:zinc finger protein 521 isoform X2 [Hyalella azteca]